MAGMLCNAADAASPPEPANRELEKTTDAVIRKGGGCCERSELPILVIYTIPYDKS